MEESSNVKTNFNQLPSDMVIKIVSDIDNAVDLKNCMLISKEIRDMIFKTPDIMRKISFKIDENYEEAYEFLCEKGSYIRNLEFYDYDDFYDLIVGFLHKMPNLEILKIRLHPTNSESLKHHQLRKILMTHNESKKEISSLTNLFIEKLNLDVFENFTFPNLKTISIGRIAKSSQGFFGFWDVFVSMIPNIQNFMVKHYHYTDPDIFSYILCSTKGLKELKNFMICRNDQSSEISSIFWLNILQELNHSPGHWKTWNNYNDRTHTTLYYIVKSGVENQTLEFLKENFEGFDSDNWINGDKDMSYLLYTFQYFD